MRTVGRRGLLGRPRSAVAITAGSRSPSSASIRTRPELGGALGADGLLQARRRARHDQRALVEGQDLAERVVAAHGDDAARPLHQLLEMRHRR